MSDQAITESKLDRALLRFAMRECPNMRVDQWIAALPVLVRLWQAGRLTIPGDCFDDQ